MARKPRIHYPGAFYHVMLRGNGGWDIFFSDDDRHHFFLLIKEGIERYHHRIHAFCLMRNHVHLALQVQQATLSSIMQNLSFRYTRFINKMQNRSGHLFQGRYKAILIDSDKYLTQLVRYIHCNPVRAKVVKNPLEYQWSSHKAYLAKETIPWLTTDFILSQFDQDQNTARSLYGNFVEAGIEEGHRDEFYTGLSGGCILGDDKFSENVHRRSVEEWNNRWSYDQIISSLCSTYGIEKEIFVEPGKRQPAAEARAVAAYLVQENDHLSLTGLGTILNRDISGLSRAAGRIRNRLKKDIKLNQRIRSVKKLIGEMSKSQA